jgi:hypothetical protein
MSYINRAYGVAVSCHKNTVSCSVLKKESPIAQPEMHPTSWKSNDLDGDTAERIVETFNQTMKLQRGEGHKDYVMPTCIGFFDCDLSAPSLSPYAQTNTTCDVKIPSNSPPFVKNIYQAVRQNSLWKRDKQYPMLGAYTSLPPDPNAANTVLPQVAQVMDQLQPVYDKAMAGDPEAKAHLISLAKASGEATGKSIKEEVVRTTRNNNFFPNRPVPIFVNAKSPITRFFRFDEARAAFTTGFERTYGLKYHRIHFDGDEHHEHYVDVVAPTVEYFSDRVEKKLKW